MRQATVVVMCGLPASGKTTTAERLHASAGGTLIRSCDVYADLGISLPDWVRKTRGFTEDVSAYERLRDRAYVEMGRRLAGALATHAPLVVVDAVHGERAKRAAVYAICRDHRAAPLLLWCRCDDLEEIGRRLAARRGREHEPPHEASDLSVFHHVRSLWQDPGDDRLPGGEKVPLVVVDTL